MTTTDTTLPSQKRRKRQNADCCRASGIPAAGTYYLAETTTLTGYHPNDTVYVVTAEQKYVVKNGGTENAVTEIQMHTTIDGLTGTTTNNIDYTYNIENTAIETVVITVEKSWNDGGYHDRPEEITATLYRDGQEYDSVKLNEDNAWKYIWSGAEYTDAYTWSVDEKAEDVPTDYTKSVTNQGNDWIISNSHTPRPVEITVTKEWEHNGGKDLPESIRVTLYQDDEVYQTVTLSEDNEWTYTWDGLTDVSVWRVDETEVPAGYTKVVTVEGYSFVITNTRTINPVEVSATKVWVASEGVKHPKSVEAVLYCDGDEYATVELNVENDWTYTWEGLTDEHTWTV